MNNLDILKNNLEIIKIKKLIDESNLNQEFKKEVNDFLFSKENNNYSFNEVIPKNYLQFNKLINIIKETISDFNLSSNDIKLFEKKFYQNVNNFYKFIGKPRNIIVNKIDNLDKIRYDDNIYYLHDYVPDTTPADFLWKFTQKKIDTSREINEKYKENDKEAFRIFTKELMCAVTWISNNKINTDVKNICLVAVPSSTKKRDNDAPIRKSIDTIEKWYNSGRTIFEFPCSKNIINGDFLLYRFEDTKTGHRVSINERPTYEDHMRTIKVNDEHQFLGLENTVFIIIDDISTRKNSLNACNDILIKNGINQENIIKLVIGKTVWWSR